MYVRSYDLLHEFALISKRVRAKGHKTLQCRCDGGKEERHARQRALAESCDEGEGGEAKRTPCILDKLTEQLCSRLRPQRFEPRMMMMSLLALKL